MTPAFTPTTLSRAVDAAVNGHSSVHGDEIRRLQPPATLTPREIIRRCLAAGMSRTMAKEQYARLVAKEWWGNSVYSIGVDRDTELHAMGDDIRVVHISFHRRDQGTALDWRDMQAIKNAICGPDAEAMSLNPCEERVVDTSNEFHLWVPFYRDSGRPLRIPIGWQAGLRTEMAYEGSVQRPLKAT